MSWNDAASAARAIACALYDGQTEQAVLATFRAEVLHSDRALHTPQTDEAREELEVEGPFGDCTSVEDFEALIHRAPPFRLRMR